MDTGISAIADAKRSALRRLIVVAASAAFGGLMFGFDVAIITGAGPFIERHFGLSHIDLGIAFSALLFGCVVGAAAAGPSVERFGRRKTLIAVAVVFALTTWATGAATSFSFFVAARFLGGLAVGAVSLAAPMYISEIAPAQYRGRLGALYQMALVSGILISYLINFALKDAGPDAWRYMFYTGVLPASFFFVLMVMAPESPRYLVKSGRRTEALAVLAATSVGNEAQVELASIDKAQSETASASLRGAGIGILRPLWVSFFLAIFVHLSGVNTVIDYAPRIFASAGFDLNQALLFTIVVGVANFVFTAISFWTIDRFGRRALYLVGSIGMGVALTALAAAAAMNAFEGGKVLLLIVIYLLFFASCIGPVFWTLLPEIFPNSVRGKAMTLPVFTQWIANAVVVLLFPAFFSAMGQQITFGFLALACFGQAVFTYYLLPETRNVPLEQMENLWRRNCHRKEPASPSNAAKEEGSK